MAINHWIEASQSGKSVAGSANDSQQLLGLCWVQANPFSLIPDSAQLKTPKLCRGDLLPLLGAGTLGSTCETSNRAERCRAAHSHTRAYG